MQPWTPLDLVLLPAVPDDGDVPAPLAVEEVAAALADRGVLATALDAARIGVAGGVVVRLAMIDGRVAVTDREHAVHRGPSEGEVVLGLAHRVGALVHVEGLLVGSDNRVRDEAVLDAVLDVVVPDAPSSATRRATAWRDDDDLLLAAMTAAELGVAGEAAVVDGWAVVAWPPGAPLPDDPLPLPARHHPLVHVSRTGDLRTLALAPAPGADVLEVTWVPRLAPVLAALTGSPAAAVLAGLEVAGPPDPDDWPDGFDLALRPRLLALQDGPGEAFLPGVADLLLLPPFLARAVEHAASGPLPAAPGEPAMRPVGGRSARQVAWDHVRTPSPETDAERRLRETPWPRVVLQVGASLLLAVAMIALVVWRDLRFVPEWLFWAGAGFLGLNAVATLWFRARRPPH